MRPTRCNAKRFSSLALEEAWKRERTDRRVEDHAARNALSREDRMCSQPQAELHAQRSALSPFVRTSSRSYRSRLGHKHLKPLLPHRRGPNEGLSHDPRVAMDHDGRGILDEATCDFGHPGHASFRAFDELAGADDNVPLVSREGNVQRWSLNSQAVGIVQPLCYPGC